MITVSHCDIFRTAVDWAAKGHEIALVTLVGIEGTSSRSPGTQMLVADNGRHIGSFSGGCIENAIAKEALDVLADGRGRRVRYGLGSPYIDIRLPCGGGIDLLFTPGPDPAVLAQVAALLAARQKAVLVIDEHGVSMDAASPGCRLTLIPQLRILAFGQGEDLTAFAKLSAFYGALVEIMTPDPQEILGLTNHHVKVRHLHSRGQLPLLDGDPWTAIVFLFHDHDWEEFLLPDALVLPAFYWGAIGSTRTHQLRLEMLRRKGVHEEKVADMRGRIGLIPATRDPATLALSILGEIAAAYRVLLPGQPIVMFDTPGFAND